MDRLATSSFTRQIRLRLRPRHGPAFSTGLGLVLFVYACYLLLYSGVFHSSDARFILAATESIVKRAELTTDQLWWHQDAIESVAPDGEPYSKYGLSASLAAAPLYLLALKWPRLGMVQAAMLTNLIVTAATAWLVWRLSGALGYRRRVALGVALAYALGTSALVYARYYFSEPLSALALTGSCLGLYVYRARRQERYAWLAGVMMGMAVLTKLINLLFLIPLLVYALDSVRTAGAADVSLRQAISGRHDSPDHPGNPDRAGPLDLSGMLAVGAPLLLALILAGIYNAARFGSPFVSGYPAWERFSHPLLAGMGGLLLSSQKGLLVYNPILVVGLLAFPLFWRQHRAEARVILAVSALHVVAYAMWHDWQGGVAWGPRFLVPLLPLLVVPLASAWEELWPAGRQATGDTLPGPSGGFRASARRQGIRKRVLWTGVSALAVASIGVQLVGAMVSFLTYGEYYGEAPTHLQAPLYPLGNAWPILGHALLFRPANWDMAWTQGMGEPGVIDWVSLAMLVGLLALAAGGLLAAGRRSDEAPRPWLGVYQGGLVLLSVAVSLGLLVRCHADKRFGGGEDYLALLQRLAISSRADDLVLLGNHIYTDFFFNHNRSAARWYALDRAAANTERTRGLLERSARRYRRIWLVTDLTSGSAAERPLEAWLAQHAYKIEEAVFSPYARLLLYETQTGPPTARQALNLRFGQDIQLTAMALSFVGRSEPIHLALTWQALGVVKQDLTVFVQMLDAGGRLVWQADRYPVDGLRPTSSWAVGEVIADHYGWQIAANLPPGEYRLIAGLYDWQTGQRLAVTDAQGASLGDYVMLGTLALERAQE